MEIKLSSIDDAPYLSAFYRENSEHLQPWEPLREASYHDIPAWENRLQQREREQSEGSGVHFLAYAPKSRQIIATCSLTGICRGAFQAGYLGYSVAKAYEGRGYMKTLCSHVLDCAFREMQLNRVMANYMPRNDRSGRLLQSLGFRREGLAKKYLYINGQWEDHILTAKLNPLNQ